jgi:hypothetical protein
MRDLRRLTQSIIETSWIVMGALLGRQLLVAEFPDDEEDESGVCEFILIANNRPPAYAHQKVTMQIKRRGGIAYRVNIADIQADAWSRAELTAEDAAKSLATARVRRHARLNSRVVA